VESEGIEREYRLLPEERVPDGLRRIALARADDAIEQLRDRAGAEFAPAVHEARKDLKKLRAVLRLLRPVLGKRTQRRENARYRDVGRRLAGARDAAAKLECLAALRELAPGEVDVAAPRRYVGLLETEREALSAGGEEPPRSIAEAVVALEGGRAELERMRLPDDGFGLIEPGLIRVYARGRHALTGLGADPPDEAVHEWRKRAKDLWYAYRLLVSAWPEAMEPLVEEAHRLSTMLGDHHDLTVLRADARRRRFAFSGDALERLEALTGRRQSELLAEALPLGRRLYAEKPNAMARRIREWWRA
jgi:CHAD domain-containing protein